jgi:NTP pyrophosphatase (non-canonical NTP hydrolase)
MNLREIQNLLTNRAFNPYINIVNSQAVLLHLTEEVGEAIKAYRKNEREKLKTEIGDIQILLCFFASSVKVDLEHETLLKINDNINKGKFLPNKDELKSFGKSINLESLFENDKTK